MSVRLNAVSLPDVTLLVVRDLRASCLHEVALRIERPPGTLFSVRRPNSGSRKSPASSGSRFLGSGRYPVTVARAVCGSRPRSRNVPNTEKSGEMSVPGDRCHRCGRRGGTGGGVRSGRGDGRRGRGDDKTETRGRPCRRRTHLCTNRARCRAACTRKTVARETGGAETFPVRRSTVGRGGWHVPVPRLPCPVQAWRDRRRRRSLRARRTAWSSPGAPSSPPDISATFLWTDKRNVSCDSRAEISFSPSFNRARSVSLSRFFFIGF